jgi:hypothetical protein
MENLRIVLPIVHTQAQSTARGLCIEPNNLHDSNMVGNTGNYSTDSTGGNKADSIQVPCKQPASVPSLLCGVDACRRIVLRSQDLP